MKKIEICTFEQFRYLSEIAISPDGKYTAFICQNMDVEANNYKGDIYLINNSTEQYYQLTAMGDAKTFIWTQNNTILFPAFRSKKKTDAEATSFYEINPTGGEARQAFTINLRVTKITCIDKDNYLIIANYDNSKDSSKNYVIFDELPFWSNGKGIVNKKRSRAYIYNRFSENISPITEELFDVSSSTVSNNYILYSGVEYSNIKTIMPALYIYDIKSKTTKELVKKNTMRIGAFSIIGDKAIVCMTEGKEYGVNQFPFLYSIDLLTGHSKLISENDATVGNSSVGSDSKLGGGTTYKSSQDKMYYITTELNHSYLRCIDIEGNISENITEIGAVDCFDIHQGNIVFIGVKKNSLNEVYKVTNGKEYKLTTINDHINNNYCIITPEPVTYVGSDGYKICGWVMKPAGYSLGTSYPAILNIHGGPRSVYSDVYFHEMQIWANDGYFVFYCNPRGSDGRGNEFGDINGKYGTVDYVNVMEFTDKVLELYPDIDPDRVGVTGGSYGGYLTNWIVGHTHRFAAACAQRSICNWITYEGVSDIGYYFTEDMLSATVHTDLEAVWESSPLKYAPNVRTPILYIQSQEDYRCWMGDSLQMFYHLKQWGIDTKYVLFYGDNHELSRSGTPQNRVKRLEEITAWFNKYLK